nr:hypothetical protein [Bacilli bacterium]
MNESIKGHLKAKIKLLGLGVFFASVFSICFANIGEKETLATNAAADDISSYVPDAPFTNEYGFYKTHPGEDMGDYIEQIRLHSLGRNGVEETIELHSPYTYYYDYHYYHQKNEYYEDGVYKYQTTTIKNDIDMWSNECNKQPLVRDIQDVVLRAYQNGTFVKNVPIKDFHQIGDDAEDIYIQNLNITFDWEDCFDEIRVDIVDLYFSESYATSKVQTGYVSAQAEVTELGYYKCSKVYKDQYDNYTPYDGYIEPKSPRTVVGGLKTQYVSLSYGYNFSSYFNPEGYFLNENSRYIPEIVSISNVWANDDILPNNTLTGRGDPSRYYYRGVCSTQDSYGNYSWEDREQEIKKYPHMIAIFDNVGFPAHTSSIEIGSLAEMVKVDYYLIEAQTVDTTFVVTRAHKDRVPSHYTYEYRFNPTYYGSNAEYYNDSVFTINQHLYASYGEVNPHIEKYNKNVASFSKWTEAPVNKNEWRSWNNYDDAFDYVNDRLHQVVQRFVDSDGKGLPFNDSNNNSANLPSTEQVTMENPFGNDFSTTTIYYKNRPALETNQGRYDCYIVPNIQKNPRNSSNVANITKLWAFKVGEEDALLEEFLNEQTRKLVENIEIFKTQAPADNFDSNQTVVTDELNYVTKIDLESAYGLAASNISLIDIETYNGFNSNEFEEKRNNLISYGTEYHSDVWATQYTWNYYVSNFCATDWKNVAVADGTYSFQEIWNETFDLSLNENEYVSNENEFMLKKNRVTFKSNDYMYVKITLNENEPEYLEAHTTYNLTTDGFCSVAERKETTYYFDKAGTYQIEMVNRAGSKITKKLTVHDDRDLMLEIDRGTNYEFKFHISNPSKLDIKFSNIKIYSVDKQEYFDDRFHIEPLDYTPDVDEKDRILVDDVGTEIDKNHKRYQFYMDGNYDNNQFHLCYYVETTLKNVTKRYYVFWNYIQPDANNLSVDCKTWEKNVGYETEYFLTFTYGTTGPNNNQYYDVPNLTGQDYVIEVDKEGIVEIDKSKKIIRAVGTGRVTITFTMLDKTTGEKMYDDELGDYIYDTLTFTITDKYELRKEIRTSKEEIYLQLGEVQVLDAWVNPDWKNQTLDCISSDPNIAYYENGKVYSARPGTVTLTFKSSDTEIADKTVTVVVGNCVGLINNDAKIMYVGDKEAVSSDVWNKSKLDFTCSNDCMHYADGYLYADAEGEVSVAIEYYGQVETIKYKIISKTTSATFIDRFGNELNPSTNDDGSLTFGIEGINSIAMEDGATATLNGQPYSGGAIVEPGSYKLIVNRTISGDDYSNSLLQTQTYNFKIPSADNLVSNVNKIVYVGDSETLIDTVSDSESIHIEISGDCIELAEDGRTLVAVKEGEATVTITYYGQTQTLKYKAISSSLTANFFNQDGTVIPESNISTTETMTFAEEGISSIELPVGSSATLNGETYSGEQVIAPGDYELIINRTISGDDYSNSLLQTVTYEFTIPTSSSLVANENTIYYIGDTGTIIPTVNYEDAMQVTTDSDCIQIADDGKSFVALKEGEATITITYFGQTETFKVKIISKTTSATFIDRFGNELNPSTNNDGSLTFSIEGINIVEISSNSSATLNGETYNGEPIIKPGTYTLTVITTISEEGYVNTLEQTITYEFVVPTKSGGVTTNTSKIMFVGDSETLIQDVSDTDSIHIEISGDCIELAEDGRTLVAVKEGEATVTITYYGQVQTLKYKVFSTEFEATFYDDNSVELNPSVNDDNSLTFGIEGLSSIGLPNGSNATLNGQPYSGGAIVEPGNYTLTITRTIAVDGYSNELNQEITYRIFVPWADSLVDNENKILYIDDVEQLISSVSNPDMLQVTISGDCLTLSQDGMSLIATKEGVAEVTINYYGQSQVLKFKVISKTLDATFYDQTGNIAQPTTAEDGTMTFAEEGISSIELPVGSSA